MQALYEGRRTSVVEAFERPRWLPVNANTTGGRTCRATATARRRRASRGRRTSATAWSTVISASEGGRTRRRTASATCLPCVARFRSIPGGTDQRALVDSGTLSNVVSSATVSRPCGSAAWSVQGELLNDVGRKAASPATTPAASPMFGWILTGESRPYSGGNTGKAKGAWGAWGCCCPLQPAGSGRRRDPRRQAADWTLGANWCPDAALRTGELHPGEQRSCRPAARSADPGAARANSRGRSSVPEPAAGAESALGLARSALLAARCLG